MGKREFAKPFDGAISRFAEKDAPKAVREALKGAGKDDTLDPAYPYSDRLEKSAYEDEYDACQLDLIRAQRWIRSEGKRVVVLFEGRDAAGKGGTIQAIRQNLNPRAARTVALSAPTETERGQWYFQRYATHFPTTGEMVLFDRSWYNRAVVEKVFGWVDDLDREKFFAQLPQFEDMLVRDGIVLIKLWLAIGRAEQLRQFLQRESDPLKQWKLSEVDVDGLSKWDAYSDAIREMFERSHTPVLPWTVIRYDDKRRGRIAAMRAVLSKLDYPGKEAPPPDPAICGGPEIIVKALSG